MTETCEKIRVVDFVIMTEGCEKIRVVDVIVLWCGKGGVGPHMATAPTGRDSRCIRTHYTHC